MTTKLETTCCADYEASFKIESASTDKMYTVTWDGTGAECDCMAFRYKKGDKECKHTREVAQRGCFWSPTTPAGSCELTPVERDDINHIPGLTCPACGGPVIPTVLALGGS